MVKKGKFQGTSNREPDATALAAHALLQLFPDGTDDFFRAPTDAPGDFVAAYNRARAHTADILVPRLAWLWEHALEIGRRAGSGHEAESVRVREASEDFELGREAGFKDGRTAGLRDGKRDGRKEGKAKGLVEGEEIGYQKGQEAGLKEGKRLGFEGGRVFGAKQCTKTEISSNPTTTEKTFADAMTETFEDTTAKAFADAAIETIAITIETVPEPRYTADVGVCTDIPVLPTTVPQFNWADEVIDSIPIHTTLPKTLPSSTLRDLSSIQPTSMKPFGSLQRRVRRSRTVHRNVFHRTTTAAQPFITRRHPSGIAPGRPVVTVPGPPASFHSRQAPSVPILNSLDWDRDPCLSDLGRALRELGWVR